MLAVGNKGKRRQRDNRKGGIGYVSDGCLISHRILRSALVSKLQHRLHAIDVNHHIATGGAMAVNSSGIPPCPVRTFPGKRWPQNYDFAPILQHVGELCYIAFIHAFRRCDGAAQATHPKIYPQTLLQTAE